MEIPYNEETSYHTNHTYVTKLIAECIPFASMNVNVN